MSDEHLAAVEADHRGCTVYGVSCVSVCDTAELVAEVRRLRRALKLSELSRGVPATVGLD